jgi:hypothetical protein
VRDSGRKRRFVVILRISVRSKAATRSSSARKKWNPYSRKRQRILRHPGEARHRSRWRRISDGPGRDAAHPCRGKPPHHCIGISPYPSQRVYISPPRPRAVTRYRFRGRPSFTLSPRARTAAGSLKVTAVSESASARARPFFPVPC